jgi:hypothetical protein
VHGLGCHQHHGLRRDNVVGLTRRLKGAPAEPEEGTFVDHRQPGGDEVLALIHSSDVVLPADADAASPGTSVIVANTTVVTATMVSGNHRRKLRTDTSVTNPAIIEPSHTDRVSVSTRPAIKVPRREVLRRRTSSKPDQRCRPVGRDSRRLGERRRPRRREPRPTRRSRLRLLQRRRQRPAHPSPAGARRSRLCCVATTPGSRSARIPPFQRAIRQRLRRRQASESSPIGCSRRYLLG